jgi:hypothetical protein
MRWNGTSPERSTIYEIAIGCSSHDLWSNGKGKTGGERSHKTVLKFDPFRTAPPKARTFDFPSWLKYPFSNTGRLE